MLVADIKVAANDSRLSDALIRKVGNQHMLSGSIKVEYRLLRHSYLSEQSLASDWHWTLYASARVAIISLYAASTWSSCLFVFLLNICSTMEAMCVGSFWWRSMNREANFMVPLWYSGVSEYGGFVTGLSIRDRALFGSILSSWVHELSHMLIDAAFSDCGTWTLERALCIKGRDLRSVCSDSLERARFMDVSKGWLEFEAT